MNNTKTKIKPTKKLTI